MFLILKSKASRVDVSTEWLELVCQAVTDVLQTSFCPAYGLAPWSVTQDTTLDGPICTVYDTPDVPNAAGYHSVDAKGVPYAKDFAIGDLDALSLTISHECFEIVTDQSASLYDYSSGQGVAYESCDPVQDTWDRHPNGIVVSNFVLPSWYNPAAKGPYDRLGCLLLPLTMTDDGYCIIQRPLGPETIPSHVAETRPHHSRYAERARLHMLP
jgi:hypothetical protein